MSIIIFGAHNIFINSYNNIYKLNYVVTGYLFYSIEVVEIFLIFVAYFNLLKNRNCWTL